MPKEVRIGKGKEQISEGIKTNTISKSSHINYYIKYLWNKWFSFKGRDCQNE